MRTQCQFTVKRFKQTVLLTIAAEPEPCCVQVVEWVGLGGHSLFPSFFRRCIFFRRSRFRRCSFCRCFFLRRSLFRRSRFYWLLIFLFFH